MVAAPWQRLARTSKEILVVVVAAAAVVVDVLTCGAVLKKGCAKYASERVTAMDAVSLRQDLLVKRRRVREGRGSLTVEGKVAKDVGLYQPWVQRVGRHVGLLLLRGGEDRRLSLGDEPGVHICWAGPNCG